MIKKILLVAAFAITPLLLSEDASAQCYGGGGYGGGYSVYRAPVVHHAPHSYHRGHGSPYRAGYRGAVGVPYGVNYGSPYRYGSGYRGYGGYPYSRGTAISVGRGGFGLRIGF